MHPLLILSIGRSGSTFLMQLLAAHPAIVGHEAYPLELRLWPAALFPGDTLARKLADNSARHFLRRPAPQTPDEVLETYADLARGAGKEARFFAEKFGINHDLDTACRLHPETRCICVARDPRDMLLSARAMDRKRGYYGFGLASDRATVNEVLEKAMSAVFEKHLTAPSADASIGRWRTEMHDDLKETFKAHLADFLMRLGYPLE